MLGFCGGIVIVSEIGGLGKTYKILNGKKNSYCPCEGVGLVRVLGNNVNYTNFVMACRHY